ncbi:MAG: DUF881 domain-containing protein [Clostridia bacterium]|nr:DUF881 domain-containing protein [Clostridia bacterium]
MKGRGTIIFTIGAVVALLVAIILMQFRTVEETDISTLEAMRETELRAEVASWKEKYEEASKQLTETQAKITEYYETMESKDEAAKVLEQELLQAKMRIGQEAVTGSGIEVTLEDNIETQIDDYDIYKLINELRLAGAEAISVNEVRITAMSDVKSIAPGLIHIDGNPLHSPYIIKAIGDQTYLVSALNQKTYGYMDYVIKSYDKTGYITTRESIVIPATKKVMKFEYAEEVKQ